ncbi:hypothetical protein ACOMHN_011663 [Nucella lapillus]
MAVLIKRSSATLACLYTHFILLVILCVFNFTVVVNFLPVNMGYGIALIFFSVIATILGITAQDAEDSLLRSLLLCVSVLWTAVGIYHVVESVNPTGTTDEQALWAGYGTFLLIFLFFIFGSLHHRSHFTAVLSLGYFLACIFEISSLWRPLRTSVGAYYLLMAALLLYMIASIVLRKFRQGEPAVDIYQHVETSRDYLPLGHAMNTLAFALFAAHVTGGITTTQAQMFMWSLSAGAYQLMAGVLAVRRSDVYSGFFFCLYSLLWLVVGYNHAVQYVTGVHVPNQVAVVVIFFIVFFLMALASLFREMFQFVQNLIVCVLVVATYTSEGAFLGTMGWILFVISLYPLAAHISRVKNSSFKLPLGMRCLEGEHVKRFVETSCRCCLKRLYGAGSEDGGSGSGGNRRAMFTADFILGYSRYRDLDAAGFASNAITLMAVLWIPVGPWVMPWALAFGGLTQYIVGSVCFARGLTFESCNFFIFGSLWLIWGPFRGLGVIALDNGPAMVGGCVGLMVVTLLQLVLSFTVSIAWSLFLTLFMLVLIGFLINAIALPAAFVYEIVIGVLFVLLCLYFFLSSALRSAMGREVLPLGRPLLQVSYLHSQGTRALWADASRATGVKTIADIMNRGGICGIPTDVVYTLVAAVKFPKSVLRAYNTKEAAEDRPMSMWISRTEQLQEGRPLFGELVWAFMNEVWPSTVSCVIPKGQWLDNLGIGEANPLVGRPDSIAVRMPDNCVTSYLVDQTGPIAVTSANPTGEADTTHHLQVLAKLGLDNVDGILCSGPSPENMASTVVDTRQMSKGTLNFFRIGVVPRARVEAIFESVRVRFNEKGSTLPPSVGQTTGGEENQAFIHDNDDDNNSDSGVSGGNGGGSQEDSGSLNHQPLQVDLEAPPPPALIPDLMQSPEDDPNQDSGISGRLNPIYDDSAGLAFSNGSGFSSFTSNTGTTAGELSRAASAVSVGGHHLPPAPEGVTEEDGPYESMVVLPSGGGMQLQTMPGKNGAEQQAKPEPRFAVNPMFAESPQI